MHSIPVQMVGYIIPNLFRQYEIFLSFVQYEIFLSLYYPKLVQDQFPNLEIFEWEMGDAMNETYGGPSAEFYCNLKHLELKKNHGKPSIIVGNENSQPGDTFPNLEAPEVSEFCRLKILAPFSSTSFKNLTKLDVQGFDELISLLTPSMASLVKLSYIRISECKRMTEVVANEGGQARDEIAFNNLEYLIFGDVPSLTAFYLGDCIIKFPSLVEVTVTNCPKLKIFSNGVLTTPKLKDIRIRKEYYSPTQKFLDGDLNAMIKQFWDANFNEKVCFHAFIHQLIIKYQVIGF